MIDAGQDAPDFSLPSDSGEAVSLAALRGRPVVLFFYPKDDTSGCTTEAIGFSEKRRAFEAAGVAVLGVSKDSVKRHQKFRDKHALAVTLLSDEAGDVCERFGVWVEKSMYGKTYMGIERTTFLLDGDGKVARLWRKVTVPGHVDEVLSAAEALGKRPGPEVPGPRPTTA